MTTKKKPAKKTTKTKTRKATKKMTKTTKNLGGRPPSPFPERYQLRHGADQMADWMRAAGVGEPGPALQEWMRETLDARARMSRKKPVTP
jgi:hypothetical protein